MTTHTLTLYEVTTDIPTTSVSRALADALAAGALDYRVVDLMARTEDEARQRAARVVGVDPDRATSWTVRANGRAVAMTIGQALAAAGHRYLAEWTDEDVLDKASQLDARGHTDVAAAWRVVLDAWRRCDIVTFADYASRATYAEHWRYLALRQPDSDPRRARYLARSEACLAGDPKALWAPDWTP